MIITNVKKSLIRGGLKNCERGLATTEDSSTIGGKGTSMQTTRANQLHDGPLKKHGQAETQMTISTRAKSIKFSRSQKRGQ